MKIKYNWDYDRYVTEDGNVFRYDSKQDKLVLCKLTPDRNDYLIIQVQSPKKANIKVHRLVYETFVGNIPQGYQIDHINTVRNDNRVENLRCVTHTENNNNPLTRKHKSKAQINKIRSEFGRKFKEHYGFTNYENPKLYHREQQWYHTHNHRCRWEVVNEPN